MSNPEVTLSPADKLTAKEWHEEKADRRIKERLYTQLASRLVLLDAECAQRLRVALAAAELLSVLDAGRAPWKSNGMYHQVDLQSYERWVRA
jgi:hypothetical protein